MCTSCAPSSQTSNSKLSSLTCLNGYLDKPHCTFKYSVALTFAHKAHACT